MDHEERIQIAEHLTKKVLQRYKKHILVGGLCGSTARGEDHDYSDIEILFITQNNANLKSREFLLGDINIALAFERLQDVEKRLKRVDFYWPLEISRYFCFKRLWGDEKALQRFHQIIKSLPDKKFEQTLKESIPHTLDLLNKIRNARREKSLPDAIEYVRELLYAINLSLGLLNRKYFTKNYYKNFLDSFAFKKLPLNYEEVVKKLWISKKLEEMANLSEKLINNYLELLKKDGLEGERYSSIDEIQL